MAVVYDDLVLCTREDAISVLTLHNPARRNAFSKDMQEVFLRHLLRLHDDPSCRVIVVTGVAGQFCSGGDLSEMHQRPALEARQRMDLATRIFKLLATGPKPFVAAAEGNVAKTGLSLLAASDYAVVAADARLACTFVKMGLLPDVGGLWSISRRVGPRRAMELCAFGESFGAQAALEMELINEIAVPGQALARAMEVARRFAKNPPLAMALLRSALATGAGTLDQAVNSEINLQSILMNTDDFSEALNAFRQKRKPVFKGGSGPLLAQT